MKLIHYIVIIDVLLIVILTKMIFRSFSVFGKAIAGHIFSDFSEIEPFKKWEEENNIAHKMNLLYATILGIGGGTFLIYTQI